MCSLAEVSRAGYYRQWQQSEPRQLDMALRERIHQLALEHRHYGYRRIHQCLMREGWVVNRKRVLRLTQRDNLLCLRKKPFVPATTDWRHDHKIWPNLAPGLQLSRIDQLWVADITYIRLKEEFVYLAVVLDAYSRRVIGWALEPFLTARLPIAALRMALINRKPHPGLVHHSDRGVQYASADYTAILLEHGIEISMSRPAYPYDNAKAESFMKTLKQEQIHDEEFHNLSQLRKSLHRFLEDTYNRKRLHSALSYRSPLEFEQQCGTETCGLNPLLAGEGGSCVAPFPRPQPRA
jgi:transposase InsO family protein